MQCKKAALICGNFRRELEMAVEFEKLDGVEVAAFSPECRAARKNELAIVCNSPDISEKEFGAIHIFQSACAPGVGRAGLYCGRYIRHVERLCFYMLANKTAVDSLIKDGAYLLTPGWLAKWKYYLAGWGMERSMAREFFAETARSLVLLDTLVDSASHRRLAEFSDFVRRPAESIPVGLDFFRGYVRSRLELTQ